MSAYLPTVFGENLMDVFDDFDRNFFRGFGNVDRALYGKHASHMMKTDVKETEDGYEVDVDLPGFKKDEIHVELNNGYLTISTAKSLEKDERGKKGRMLRQERFAGAMQRSFYVGEYVTEEDVKASYDSGVLHLMIPKKDAPKLPRKRPFKSKAENSVPWKRFQGTHFLHGGMRAPLNGTKRAAFPAWAASKPEKGQTRPLCLCAPCAGRYRPLRPAR